MPNSAAALDVQPVSRLFKALGDETRLRIVALLAHGELCVCHLEMALDLNQSTTSRQLAVLRNAGVVETRREGAWVYYRLAEQADAECAEQLRALCADFLARPAIAREVKQLRAAKGPRSCQ